MSSNTYDIEAEFIGIKSILDGAAEVKAHLLANIGADYFGTNDCVDCIERILTLIGEGKDPPGTSVFVTDPALPDDAKTALANCPEILPAKNLDDAAALVETLKYYRMMRVAFSGAKSIITDIRGGDEDANAVVDKLEQIIYDARANDASNTKIISAGRGDTEHADVVVESILRQDTSERIPTGFKNFDRIAGGYRRSNLVVIAGPTSGGKSVMANQLCKNMYFDHHYNTCLVSFEMDDSENVGRLLSNISQVPYGKIEMGKMSGTQVQKVRGAWDKFKSVGEQNNCRFSVWCPSGELTAGHIVSYLKPKQFDVVIIDYIGLVGYENNKVAQWEALGNTARAFKLAAKPLNAAVVLLAQFDSEKQVVRYARSLKEHANIMWTWNFGDAERETGDVEINQEKNRNVHPFKFMLKFKLDTMTITDSDKAPSSVDIPSSQSTIISDSVLAGSTMQFLEDEEDI